MCSPRSQPAQPDHPQRLCDPLSDSTAFNDNPSLASKLDEAIEQAYRLAVIETERETGLPETTFPVNCPFAFSQMMDDAFWPDGD
ncbi:DUF29 family protein [Thioalkalicoccus limnaeus]|uniref:DUF29 family protein n=1 Tax=Thioalkalicoccus limnaeus TaxID=120681 RepID=A0ABV4BNU5_9GAMM